MKGLERGENKKASVGISVRDEQSAIVGVVEAISGRQLILVPRRIYHNKITDVFFVIT